jgi:hypothetical protein
MVERLMAEGCTSARQIAQGLNDAGVASRAGGKWHSASVIRLLHRLRLDE